MYKRWGYYDTSLFCMAENVTMIREKILFDCHSGPPWFIKAAMPRFVAWPASGDMKLRCPADGEPPLKYQWLKDGKVLNYRRLDPKYVSVELYTEANV
mgnify:CR=1 FL=1